MKTLNKCLFLPRKITIYPALLCKNKKNLFKSSVFIFFLHDRFLFLFLIPTTLNRESITKQNFVILSQLRQNFSEKHFILLFVTRSSFVSMKNFLSTNAKSIGFCFLMFFVQFLSFSTNFCSFILCDLFSFFFFCFFLVYVYIYFFCSLSLCFYCSCV